MLEFDRFSRKAFLMLALTGVVVCLFWQSTTINKLEAKIDKVCSTSLSPYDKALIRELEEDQALCRKKLSFLWDNVLEEHPKWIARTGGYVRTHLDLTKDLNVYNQIQTSLGLSLFILVKEVVPQGDGFLLRLQIGNPHTVRLNNALVEIGWYENKIFEGWDLSHCWSDKDDAIVASKSTKQVVPALEVGKWTSMDVFLSNCTAKDLETVLIGVETNSAEITLH